MPIIPIIFAFTGLVYCSTVRTVTKFCTLDFTLLQQVNFLDDILHCLLWVLSFCVSYSTVHLYLFSVEDRCLKEVLTMFNINKKSESVVQLSVCVAGKKSLSPNF